jgi:flagellar biosynthesis/type III secretory pathway M-ring protein FliF/YscJ
MSHAAANQQVNNGRSGHFLSPGRLLVFVVIPLGAAAAGIAVVWWLMQPSYVVLTRGNDAADLALVAAQLQDNHIQYHYDSATGDVMVPAEDIHDARMALAVKGIMFSSPMPGAGYARTSSDLDGNSSLQTNRSQQKILELELAKTIASIDPVRSARVHLVVGSGDDQSSGPSRASVVVRLYPGRQLKNGQIDAVAHLVASSTAGLSLEQITIVDQTGRLLKSAGESVVRAVSSPRFEYRQRIEQDYVERIENILKPILGAETVRTQVTAEVDFNGPSHGTDQATGTSPLSGTLRRLSATVIVDDKRVTAANGNVRRVSRNKGELSHIGALVKEAIGFREERGDRVNIINEPFNATAQLPSPQTGNLLSGSFLDMAPNGLYLVIVAAILLLSLIVLAIKQIITRRWHSGNIANAAQSYSGIKANKSFATVDEQQDTAQSDGAVAGNDDEKLRYDQSMRKARDVVQQDPKLVAQVLKQWVREG